MRLHRSDRLKEYREWIMLIRPLYAGLFLIIALLRLPQVSAADLTVYLPLCGSDPAANTKTLQDAIDHAQNGTTLVLPHGTCVVAKCDVVYGNGNPSRSCYGAAGTPHYSALHIGKKATATPFTPEEVTTNITLAGAADGTSVLKLDPNPPRTSSGYHPYCGTTHVLQIQGSRYITLHDFTIDGSDGELPEDSNQCAGGRSINEHMFDVYVLNSTDITIDRMNLNNAHGDGVNLIANTGETTIPLTERV